MPPEYSKLIAKIDKCRSLVGIYNANGELKQYVVCSYYNPNDPFGSQWCWGHYFTDFIAACKYIVETTETEEE